MSAPLLARAPGRVNLIGEHTDYTGGLALPIAIDRWTEVVGVAADDHVRLVSADADGVVDIKLDDRDSVEGLPPWGRYVKSVLDLVPNPVGIDGRVTTTIPVGAGLSSSAALEIAVALAIGFRGSPIELAELGQRAEHDATGVPTGIMDQLCIATAQPGHATLIDCTDLTVDQIPIPDDVGIVVRHVAHRTLEGSEYSARVDECQVAESQIGPLRLATPIDVLSITDDTIRRRARHVVTENQRVRDFCEAIGDRTFDEAGKLMTRSHVSLRDDYQVSTNHMDRAVEELLATPGVFGARMTGGGFGGCVVALVDAEADVDGWSVHPVAGAHRSA